MSDDELNPTPTDEAPVAIADDVAAPDAEATVAAAPAEVDPNDFPDSGPLADAPPAPPPENTKPKEKIRGIHPELICSCPECDPGFCELQWFSPEEQKKQKGDVMLFCASSSRKYFTPIINLNEWIAEKGGPRKRGRGANADS